MRSPSASRRIVGPPRNREGPRRPEKNEQDSDNRTIELINSVQDRRERKKKKVQTNVSHPIFILFQGIAIARPAVFT